MPVQPNGPIAVAPVATESLLRVVLMIIGIALWIVIVLSIIGLVYGIVLGLVFFFAHMMLIAHLRGNSVRLGPQQMPKLHDRVAHLAQRIGMAYVPDVYLMQSGGVLNAFATHFGRRRFVVLYSELVTACGDNVDALDFIIAHELGHLHRGHLNWRWLVAPAMFIPFLGTAYSRACEYTCDRYGFLAGSDPNRSLDGLCILAAGPQFGPYIDKRAFIAQRQDLDTAFMKLGQWFATHPPLAKRVAALVPALDAENSGSFAATLGAVLMAFVLFVVPVFGAAWAVKTAINDTAKKIGAHTTSPVTSDDDD